MYGKVFLPRKFKTGLALPEDNCVDLYAQDRTSGAWVILNVPGLDVMDTFPSFDALLAQVLRNSLTTYT